MAKIVFMLAACTVLLSCSGKEDERLGVTVQGSATNLINAKTTSCYAQKFSPTTFGDVPARYFTLTVPQLTWASTTTEAHVVAIRFVLAGGPMGDVKKEISGDELRALFGVTNPALDNVIPAASSDTVPGAVTMGCKFIVGSVDISEVNDVAFDFIGTGTIEGFERDLNPPYTETEFTRDFYFTVHNRGQ